jgi:gliding motility-associated-like protein
MLRSTYRTILLAPILCLLSLYMYAAPVPGNNDCAAASVITIPSGGFGLGTFSSVQTDLTEATVQTGETFAPAIFVAGLDKKSVWFKFSLATIRAVRVTLTQPGTTITAGDAGFAVYQTSSCLPTNADISTKLTPIVTFGNTYHPCVPTGEYLIQVSSNFNANGPIVVQIEITDQTGAAYDHPDQAYAFGTAGYYARKVDFNTECHSIEDSSEICSAFSNPYEYNKSAWLTFKTPSYFDYLVIQLSGNNGYFPSNLYTVRTFGYHLYKGDAVTTPIGSLVSVSGCDSLRSEGYYAGYKVYKCGDLDTGTTYSIQIFIKKDFSDDIRIGIMTGGVQPTRAPKPILSEVPAPNAVGNLPNSPAGIYTYYDDVWGCNSRHSNTTCGPALPDTGVVFGGAKYNLSSFFTFTLTNACAVYFDAYPTQCGPAALVRVFKQGLTNSCADLDTANIIGTFSRNRTIDCLQPGDYTVQVSGQDQTDWYGRFNYGVPLYNAEQCLSNNLGTGFRFTMTAYTRNAANKYAINVTGAFDTINRVGSVMQPLVVGTNYQSAPDTMGCQNTLLPSDTACNPTNGKAIYREFAVADSGVVSFSTLTMPYNGSWRYRLYSGDANALATAQNVFAFPDKVSGLVPKSECLDGNVSCVNRSVCVTPGTFTFVTFGGEPDVGRADRPTFTFTIPKTKFNSPFNAQDLGNIMDTLGPAGGTKTTETDVWDCTDNAVPINGYEPCTFGGRPATKAIYRQFFLKEDALVSFSIPYYWYCANRAFGYKTLFYGKATDGLAGLSPVGTGWNCFQTSAGTTAGCNLLPAGWYTVVSYNQGPNYDSMMRSTNLEGRYNSAVSYYDEFNITITPTCPGPKYNRPYKASVNTGNQPHAIQLVNRNGHTAAYPRTDTTYVLPTERFNCTLDTPFTSHPVRSCETGSNRVVYYVFRTTQQCFLQINAGGYFSALYDKDVRTDSLLFTSLTPLQPCNSAAGYTQYCYFQPGTYTLVIFAKDANICQSVTPSIYVDQIGYSRFDFAARAYDFGVIPPDSTFHFGKLGDVNPLNAARKPSSDFFYCTTGADSSNPADPVCNTKINPNVYNSGPNKPLYDSVFTVSEGTARRNLWYTFVTDHPGNVRVRVENKHDLRGYNPRFAVYRSNVDASLPFSNVVSSGQVDSTTTQGLGLIGVNQIVYWPYHCFSTYNEVSFYRDPCSAVPTRYYILVENVNAAPNEPGGTLPNTQVEVSVMVDSVNLILPKFDHYFEANNIGTVGAGTYQGETDNYSCATKDATDPFYYYGSYANCRKTLWYKFTSTITGNVRYRINVNGTRQQDYYHVQLFREAVPGDSTSNGLKIQGYTGVYGADNTYWAQTCVSPGNYYIMLTGCDQVNAYVFPEIELIEAVGDFCGRAIPTAINGAGAVTASVLINCHTIGTDYGEFGPQLTCPQGANTVDYKSSWFRMDIGGTDTLDVTAFLVENTNAASSDIKYRMMTGDCGAMQEQSCVLDALTQNTYQCLAPGQSYYIQVFSPISKFNQAVTGTIDLRLSAIAHADTCAPLTNCLASANFTPLFDCTKDDSVKFVNYSTYGTSISYLWNFGYNNQTSTEVSPYFFYPALPYDSTYSIKLVVENTSCSEKDSVTRTFTVPARPFIDFGNDIASCGGSPVTLVATSHPGAVYTWNNGSTDDSLVIASTGSNEYWVKVDYASCSSRDTVRVVISNITDKPVQNIILCTDSVSISASRGQGETYQWNTGATTASIYASTPGVYWADIRYFTCTYRDSFVVNNVSTAQPLGNDTTACLSGGGYVLRATTTGAQSYTWQNGSTADTFNVTAPGEYSVSINFGNCIVNDTVTIGGYPAPVVQNTDTSFCEDASFTLPWGQVITAPGMYRDTLRYGTGCDSLLRQVTVSRNPKPNLGGDTTLCLAQNPYVLNGTATGAISYQWQDGSASSTFNVTAPGLHWVQVNFATCSTRDSIIISGSAPPVTVLVDTAVCEGSSLTLPWGPVINTAGSYRDTLSSVLGCDSLIQVMNVTVNAKPNLGNNVTADICPGSTYDLNTSFVTGTLATAWTFNNGVVPDPSSVNAAGTYQLIVINSNGCSDTGTLTLSLHPAPALGNDTIITVCETGTVNLTALYNTAGLTTIWTNTGNPVANPAMVNVAGTYQLVVQNGSGCSDTAEVNLATISNPALGNDTTINICSGTSIDLTALYNLTGLTAAWTFGNGVVSNPAAVTDSGTYRLIATNNNGCADTAFVNILYHTKPVLGNDITTAICEGSSYNLTTAYNTNGLNNNWTFNNLPETNPGAVNNAGTYQLIAANNEGCADTALLTLSYNSKPNVGTDNVESICSGNNFNLTSLYNTSSLTSEWTINFNPVADASAVNAPGIYQLIATNAQGCKDTAFVILSVNNKPSIGSDNSVTICEGRTTDLTALYNTNGLITVWTEGNNFVSNPAVINIGGSYQLIASTQQGCSDTAAVIVTVNPKPDLGIDKIENVCQGNTINLTTLFNTGTNSNSWTIGGSAVNNPSAIAVAGNYQLISSTSAGCADTARATVNIVTAPTVVTNNQGPICSPQTFDLTTAPITAGSSPNLSFTYWEDALATVSYPTPAAAAAGTLFIKGVDINGCFSIAPVQLSYYPLPVINAGNDFAVCDQDSGILTATVTNITVPVTYVWEPVNEGGIRNPSAPSTVVAPAGTQQYVLTVTDGHGCNYDVKDTVVVTMQPPVNASAGRDTIASTGIPHQLQATGGINYAWEPASLLNNPSVSNPLATITADSVLFTVRVTDAEGCTGFAAVKVRTLDGITYYVPNAFSPNGDGKNDLFKPIPVGIVATQFFRIFNRYGELVFETNQYLKGWDGTHRGTPQQVGNYVWVLKGTNRAGKTIEMRGNVLLVR